MSNMEKIITKLQEEFDNRERLSNKLVEEVSNFVDLLCENLPDGTTLMGGKYRIDRLSSNLASYEFLGLKPDLGYEDFEEEYIHYVYFDRKPRKNRIQDYLHGDFNASYTIMNRSDVLDLARDLSTLAREVSQKLMKGNKEIEELIQKFS